MIWRVILEMLVYGYGNPHNLCIISREKTYSIVEIHVDTFQYGC